MHHLRNGNCCYSLCLAIGSFFGPARTLQSAIPASPSPFPSTPSSSSVIASSPSSKPFNSCSAPHSSLSLQHFFLGYKFVCDIRATHCPSPAENRTNFVETHPHVHGVDTPFTSSMMTVRFECADSLHPAPRQCQFARPSSLRSKASQRLHS